jgi:hypothetical protein
MKMEVGMEPEKTSQSEDAESLQVAKPVESVRLPEPLTGIGPERVVQSSAWVHFIWATAFVAIFALTAIWVLPLFMARELGNQGADAIRRALKPSVEVKSIFSQLLGSTDRTRKLVVVTQTVDVELYRENHKRVLNDWFPAGSAWVRVKVLDNRVQFYVPVEEITGQNFIYDDLTGTLRVIAPPMRIDREMVSVQSDPEKIIVEEKGSWVPLIGPKAETLRKEAMSELKNEVLKAANHELVKEEARREAQKALEQFFGLLKASLRDDVKLQIYLP